MSGEFWRGVAIAMFGVCWLFGVLLMVAVHRLQHRHPFDELDVTVDEAQELFRTLQESRQRRGVTSPAEQREAA